MGKKYILFNDDGSIYGRYLSDPENGAIPVDNDLFSRTIREKDGVWKLVKGEVVKEPFPEYQPRTTYRTDFAPREFLKRFTIEEYAKARRHENIYVQLALDNMIAAQNVSVLDDDTIKGLDLMVQAGVLTEARQLELLEPVKVVI